MTLRATTFWIVLALAGFATPAAAQRSPAELEAIRQAIEASNAAAVQAASRQPASARPTDRLPPGTRGHQGAFSPNGPARPAGPARPYGPAGRSVSPDTPR